MGSLVFRNLFFTILQPGLVVGLFPYLIVRSQLNSIFAQPLSVLNYIALLIFAIGFVILVACILRFPSEGKGTISPLDETKQLVLGGLYKYSRNPMYTGAMLILAAGTLFTQSVSLLIYSIIVFIYFNLFVILHEEPRLQKDFGEQYAQYRKQVRRWL